jgi:hypothetical protein
VLVKTARAAPLDLARWVLPSIVLVISACTAPEVQKYKQVPYDSILRMKSDVWSGAAPIVGEAHGWIVGSLGTCGTDARIIRRRVLFWLDDGQYRPAKSASAEFHSGYLGGALYTAPDFVFEQCARAADRGRSSVYVFPVRPGPYRLNSLFLESQGSIEKIHPSLDELRVKPVFTVEAGKITYVGELLSHFGSTNAGTVAHFLHRDSEQRDVAFAKKNIPSLSASRSTLNQTNVLKTARIEGVTEASATDR